MLNAHCSEPTTRPGNKKKSSKIRTRKTKIVENLVSQAQRYPQRFGARKAKVIMRSYIENKDIYNHEDEKARSLDVMWRQHSVYPRPLDGPKNKLLVKKKTANWNLVF